MTDKERKQIIEELKSIEATAAVLQEQSYRIRTRLEVDSSTTSPRKGLSPDQKARILHKRRVTTSK